MVGCTNGNYGMVKGLMHGFGPIRVKVLMHGFRPKMPPLAWQGKGLGLKPTAMALKWAKVRV